MDARSLACFLAVADTLHFGKAADRVFLSQPALSARIRALEDEIGTTLFERDRRRVVLTAAGEAFLGPARSAAEQLALARSAALQASRGEMGTLRIGFTVIAIHGALPATLRDYRRRFPGVKVELVEPTSPAQEAALVAGHIDVGVLHPPLQAAGLASMALPVEPLCIAVPSGHRLARRRSVRFADLAGEPLLMAPRHVGPHLHDQLIASLHAAGVTPDVVQHATPMTTLVGLVAAGVGLGFAAACMSSAPREGVRFLPFRGSAPELPMAVAWRECSLAGPVHAFAELISSTPRRAAL